ncbi:beta-ketoacyl-[acyl-carrier-protein] synthase family protein [Candidatus Uabimicrobium amorphum]|uniref:Beta-ketoacyl synthase n=1 Tax=Uabimicrobium amorphum TaxID=2596890 RepID=A0A5S9ISC4_UABAM|nr:beta-ketoacyl-[acyl-carrier-protein] synthase family protein [Candidatus Uabimicrobium amorphum]BBM86716.1 beta-ketoacyl synthase [Candidatus Uabimicrobium amorphum]
MNRVVITGVGVINSIANDFSQLLPALRACKRNIGSVSLFPTTATYPVAEVKNFMSPSGYRTLDLAENACEEAIKDSGIDPYAFVFSTSTIGMPELEEDFLLRHEGGTQNFNYNDALSVGEFANKLARKYNIQGTTTSFSTACSSSANAIGYAFLQVQSGICDSALAGGADALCRLTYYGFQSLKVMSPVPCTPFDVNRQGMNLGEGAAFVVLETLENAQRRGAKIYAEVMGVGMSADGHHMSSPDPEGSGASLAMNRAMKNARITVQEISYVSAHGTGTILNDHTESIAINKVFQEHTRNIYVNSLKSYVGHTLGAAGAMAIAITICSMKHGYIPPTLGLRERDQACSLRMVPQEGVDVEVPYAMINAFAFGGNNTSLVLGKM